MCGLQQVDHWPLVIFFSKFRSNCFSSIPWILSDQVYTELYMSYILVTVTDHLISGGCMFIPGNLGIKRCHLRKRIGGSSVLPELNLFKKKKKKKLFIQLFCRRHMPEHWNDLDPIGCCKSLIVIHAWPSWDKRGKYGYYRRLWSWHTATRWKWCSVK